LLRAGLLARRVSKAVDSIVDLGDFLDQADKALTDIAGSEPARALVQLAKSALVQALTTHLAVNAPRMSGLSVFWPRSTEQTDTASPFLSPLATLAPAIGRWMELVAASQQAAEKLLLPHAEAMAAAAPFLGSLAWNGGSNSVAAHLTVTGQVPAPVLVAGEMLVGVAPDASLSSGTSGGVPMRVVRSVPADVTSDGRCAVGCDGLAVHC
jgi:hypothetical protein